jgi:hypothetical protein
MKIKRENHQREFGKEMFKRHVKSLWVYLPWFLAIPVLKISFSLAMFIAGFAGVFIILKKEAPSGLFTVRGAAAIAMGIMLIILFWGLAASTFWL